MLTENTEHSWEVNFFKGFKTQDVSFDDNMIEMVAFITEATEKGDMRWQRAPKYFESVLKYPAKEDELYMYEFDRGPIILGWNNAVNYPDLSMYDIDQNCLFTYYRCTSEPGYVLDRLYRKAFQQVDGHIFLQKLIDELDQMGVGCDESTELQVTEKDAEHFAPWYIAVWFRLKALFGSKKESANE